MIYNNFKDLKLSALGMGCMRFPVLNDGNEIDIKKTKEMVDYAIDSGINYFDTAWGYHDGKSEIVIGELLKNYPRDNFYLADKFPGYDVENFENKEIIFKKQLEKCRVEYFDFYLLHTVSEYNIDWYLDSKYGLFDYLLEQKKLGKIRHLGFSAHTETDTLKRLLDSYGSELEFCQLQINWLDWDFQNAKEKVDLVTSYGLPVWIMEPVRGGVLANLSEAYSEKLKAFRNISAAEWAFRFVQDIPQAVVTLSGMSNFEQVKENIKTFSERKPLNNAEREALFEISNDIISKNSLQCTSCRYCTAYCPKKLEIPSIIKFYNRHIVFSHPVDNVAFEKNIDFNECIACKACEKVCPQGIGISNMMAELSEKINV